MNPSNLPQQSGLSPFRTLAKLQHEFDRAVESFFDSPLHAKWESLSPSCEIMDDEKSCTVKFDIPGVKKVDVKIEIDGQKLTVACERREEKKETASRRQYSEISYGAFERTISFSTPIEEKEAKASFDNGVLTVMLPKSQAGSKKQIAIQ